MTTIPQRYRQTDERTDNLLWKLAAFISMRRLCGGQRRSAKLALNRPAAAKSNFFSVGGYFGGLRVYHTIPTNWTALILEDSDTFFH